MYGDLPEWALHEAAKAYGFDYAPDPAALYPQQYELIVRIARALVAARLKGREDAAPTSPHSFQ